MAHLPRTSGFQFAFKANRGMMPNRFVTLPVADKFADAKIVQAARGPLVTDISADPWVSPAVYNLALDVGETNHQINFVGNVFMMNFATDSTVVISIGYHTPDAPKFQIGKNFFLAGFDFKKIFLTWTSQVGKVAEFVAMRDPQKFQQIRIQ